MAISSVNINLHHIVQELLSERLHQSNLRAMYLAVSYLLESLNLSRQNSMVTVLSASYTVVYWWRGNLSQPRFYPANTDPFCTGSTLFMGRIYLSLILLILTVCWKKIFCRKHLGGYLFMFLYVNVVWSITAKIHGNCMKPTLSQTGLLSYAISRRE